MRQSSTVHYEFAGWYAGQVRHTTFPSDISDITLTARWNKIDENQTPIEPTENKVNVSFRLIGSTLSGDDVGLSLGEEGYFRACTYDTKTGFATFTTTAAAFFISAALSQALPVQTI